MYRLKVTSTENNSSGNGLICISLGCTLHPHGVFSFTSWGVS